MYTRFYVSWWVIHFYYHRKRINISVIHSVSSLYVSRMWWYICINIKNVSTISRYSFILDQTYRCIDDTHGWPGNRIIQWWNGTDDWKSYHRGVIQHGRSGIVSLDGETLRMVGNRITAVWYTMEGQESFHSMVKWLEIVSTSGETVNVVSPNWWYTRVISSAC